VGYEIAAIIHSSGWLWIDILLMCEYYFCEVQWKNDLPMFCPSKKLHHIQMLNTMNNQSVYFEQICLPSFIFVPEFCSLSGNKISDDGVHALSGALKVNQSLQELK